MKYYTAAQLAELKLPGLPEERAIQLKAKREGWPSRPRSGKGGGAEYPASALPAEAQKALAARALRETKANLPAQLDLPLATDLKTYQRGTMESRAVVLAEIDRMMITEGLSQGRAVAALIDAVQTGSVSPDLLRHVAAANARGNGNRTLTRATIYNWLKARTEADGNLVALAPVAVPEAGVPEWAPTFMKLWSRPVKHSIPEILEDLWPEQMAKPSYDQTRRFLKRLDAITKNRGRVGPKALQQMKSYTARSTEDLWPGAVFIGDGHTHKSRVAHPLSGQPFRPEITCILDVFTRVWVGWSVALSENTWSVADALRHAVTTATSADILYYDNGSGANNKTWDDDCTGLCARLDMLKINSAPWTSQARGIIERFNSTVLHRVARRSISYVGERMDDEAKRRIGKITEADIKATGQSKYLPQWSEFIAEIEAEVARYNDRPHSSLPKIIDTATGRRRHMSPLEMWAKAEQDGWAPTPLSADESRDLFRPAVRRKVNRALVSWIGNEYFHPDLEALHGEYVMVAYDLHDARRVSVSLLDGRWVCDAGCSDHEQPYFPKSMLQHVHEKRVAGQLGRVEKRRENVIAQNTPRLVIDHQPEAPFSTGPVIDVAPEAIEIEVPIPQLPAMNVGGRPMFGSDTELAGWLMQHPDQVTDTDRNLLRTAMRSRNFLTMLDWEGIDVAMLRELLSTEAA